MTYKDQFVVEVKCNGKILRVQDDVIHLPFGSEYSIYLKNLNSRRAAINISIDGEDVLDGSSLILDANSSTYLEGFLRGATAKNRFKFINKTKEIQEHRGDKIDDGIIRVEFAYEKAKPIQKLIVEDHHHHDHYHWNYNDWFTGNSNVRYISSGPVIGSSADFSMLAGSSRGDDQSVTKTFFCDSNVTMDSLGVEALGQPLDDEGITVKGSECNQAFNYSSIGEVEEAEVIILRLKGMTAASACVRQPVTVKTKLKCSTCGRVSKSSAKFCSNCGTFLE